LPVTTLPAFALSAGVSDPFAVSARPATNTPSTAAANRAVARGALWFLAGILERRGVERAHRRRNRKNGASIRV